MTGSGTKNNRGRSFALALSAVIAISGAASLTGCGKDEAGSPSASSALTETTEAATAAETTDEAAGATEASEAASESTAEKPSAAAEDKTEPSETASEAGTVSGSSGITKEFAVSNVKELTGSETEIISCKEGKDDNGFSCWVIEVLPSGSSKKLTYYSGYQFCYRADRHFANNYNGIGVSEMAAINHVKEQIGEDADILSCYEGTDSMGLSCWIIIASRAGSSDRLTFYSGYQFCYSNDLNTGNNVSEDVGIDEATAIGNVRQQVGSGAEILSCTKGYSPDGIRCWVIAVAPITNGTGPDTVIYYSGYQFCYPDDTAAAGSGQNPMMNFIGNYTNGRATMLVSCLGKDKASFRITWSGSATDSAVWTMTGDVVNTGESLEVSYDNCTKQTFSYSSSGELLSNDTGYTDGSGKMVFLFSDNRAYWYDDEEDAGADTSFWYYNDTE